MQVTNTIEKTRELVNNWKKEGKTDGLTSMRDMPV